MECLWRLARRSPPGAGACWLHSLQNLCRMLPPQGTPLSSSIPRCPHTPPPPQPPPQVIAEPDERYAAYCASSDFIREHIFPGGHLPCMGAMVDAARGTGLSGGWVGR